MILWDLNKMSIISRQNESFRIATIEFLSLDSIAYGTGDSVNILIISNNQVTKNQISNRLINKIMLLDQYNVLALSSLNLVNSNQSSITFYNSLDKTLISEINTSINDFIYVDNFDFASIDINNNFCQFNQNKTEILSNSSFTALEKLENNVIATIKFLSNNNYQIDLWNFYTKSIMLTIQNAHLSGYNTLKYIPNNFNSLGSEIDKTTSTISSFLTFINYSKNLTTSSNILTTNIESTTSIINNSESSTTSSDIFILGSQNESTNSKLVAQTTTDYFQVQNPAEIVDIFSSTDIKSMNISQFIENVKNKSFSFDLKTNSLLPIDLLTSTKYDIVDCVSNCSNHGLCKVKDLKFECQCNLDFSGPNCNKDLRPCSYSPCLNYLKCENIQNGTRFNQNTQKSENYYTDFFCTCKEKFYGKRCELKINPCQNETCSGNGICKVIDNGSLNETIKCECFGINSFEGEKCEKKSLKMVVHETTVKTTTYIAIIAVICFYSLIAAMDFHKYFWKVNAPSKRKNLKKK
jgi:hypothetical protein